MKAAVVGAGIMGRLLAWQLMKRGWSVSLIDKNQRMSQDSCSFAAAGMLSPFAEVETALSGIVELGTDSMAIWQRYWEELSGDYLFGRQGSLLLSHAQDASESTRFVRILQHRAFHEEKDASNSRNLEASSLRGIPNTRMRAEHVEPPFYRVSPEELARLEPALSGFSGHALFFQNEGFVDPEGVMNALADNLMRLGVVWHDNTYVDNVGANTVSINGEEQSFDWVFDCRGLGAKQQMRGLRGVRGEAIVLHAPGFNLKRPLRLLHPRYRLYLVPRGESHYVVGASEIESDDMRPITVRTLIELLSSLYSIFPELAEASVVKTLVNCRPALPDNMPKLRCQKGLVAINGLYRHGFLLAPCLVEAAIDYVEGKVLSQTVRGVLEKITV